MPMNPRLLRPRATAPAGFDPRTIAGLALWLDASDSATLFDATTGGSLVSAGSAVGRWEDKSGNDRHATQGAANNRPQRSAATVNGLDALLFDGSNDFFTTTSFTLAQPITTLAVVRPASTGNLFCIADGAPSGTRVQMAALSGGFFRMFGGSIMDGTLSVFSANSTALVGGLFSGTSSQIRANGVALATNQTTAGTGGLTTGARVGAAIDGSSPYNGRICEMVYYSGALSSAQLSAVEAYLMRKWGIA
jgi:hypothetical protein